MDTDLKSLINLYSSDTRVDEKNPNKDWPGVSSFQDAQKKFALNVTYFQEYVPTGELCWGETGVFEQLLFSLSEVQKFVSDGHLDAVYKITWTNSDGGPNSRQLDQVNKISALVDSLTAQISSLLADSWSIYLDYLRSQFGH